MFLSRSDPSLYFLDASTSFAIGLALTLGSLGVAFLVQRLVRSVPMLEPESERTKRSRPSARMSMLRCIGHYVMIYAGVVCMLMAIPWNVNRLFPTGVSDIVLDILHAAFMLILIDFVFYAYHRASH